MVSIPFKRESVSKDYLYHRFAGAVQRVSIPFKRESVSKVEELFDAPTSVLCFNSLQTGKAYPKQISI